MSNHKLEMFAIAPRRHLAAGFAPGSNPWSAGCTGTIACRQATSRIGRVSGSGRPRPDSSSSVSTSSMTVQSSS